MCNLQVHMDNDESIEGYKIVAKNRKTGKYYSLAMGFEYNEDEDVPVVQDQFRIGTYFVDDILKSTNYRIDMRGRSAIFLHPKDARDVYIEMKGYLQRYEQIYVLCLVEATVSKDIMSGTYGILDRAVCAGKRIAIGRIISKED